MPSEHEFMKSAKDKEMSDDEYKSMREELDKKAEILSGRIKKTLIAFLAVLTVSFAALYIFGIFANAGDYGRDIGSYTFLVVQYLLAIFFYGLKAEDVKEKNYETDKKLLLAHAKDKITGLKIRFGLVTGLCLAFAALHIICWWAAGMNASAAAGGVFNDLL